MPATLLFYRERLQSAMSGRPAFDHLIENIVEDAKEMEGKRIIHTSIPLLEEEQKSLMGTFTKIANEKSREKQNDIWNDEFKPFVKKKLESEHKKGTP